MVSRNPHQPNPPVTASVRVGPYAFEVGTPAGSFAELDATGETENAEALAAALASEQSAPGGPLAAAEAFNESAAAVTKRVEQADDLVRAAVGGSLHELDSVNAEIDVLLAVLNRLDRAGRFEEELRLLRALHGPLALSLRWLDLIGGLRRGLELSDATGDRAAEAWIRHELGALHLAAGDAKTAARRFAEALRLKEQLGDVSGRCATRHNLDCAERDLARAAAPARRPQRSAGRWAAMVAFPMAALVLGVAAGRYESGDDADAAETQQQTITVSEPRAPEAVDDGAETDEDKELRIPVGDLLGNDADPNGDELSVVDVERIERQTHGRVQLEGAEVVYTPARNFDGSARFRYRISDGRRDATAAVTVEVEPVNDDPRARPDTLQLEGASDTVDVLDNDRDVDGGKLVVLDEEDGLHGTVDCTPAGACTYRADLNEAGPDSFIYIVGDGRGGEATARVTVTTEPLPGVSIDDVSVEEPTSGGPAKATFTVTLSAASSSALTVSWETGEYPDSASAEEKDFGQANGILSFGPSHTTETITIQVYQDGTSEPDELFFVQLFDPVGAELADERGDGTISDAGPQSEPEPESEPVPFPEVP